MFDKSMESEELTMHEYFVDELETSPIEIWNKIFSSDIHDVSHPNKN